MDIQEKTKNPGTGRFLLTLFLLFSLFGIAFGLSFIFVDKGKDVSPTLEAVPKAQVKLPNYSPTPTQPTPIESNAKVQDGCKLGGCNREICLNESDEVATTICLYKPVYECYRDALCEKQGDGRCDWTQTQTLSACIIEKEKNR